MLEFSNASKHSFEVRKHAHPPSAILPQWAKDYLISALAYNVT